MNYAEVKAEVRNHVALMTEPMTTSYVFWRVAMVYDVGTQLSSAYHSNPEGDRLMSQVSRALNQLADEGVVAKSVKFTHGRTRQAHWTRADVAAARQASADIQAAMMAARQAEYERTAARFAAAGITVTVSDRGVLMPLEAAERVLAGLVSA